MQIVYFSHFRMKNKQSEELFKAACCTTNVFNVFIKRASELPRAWQYYLFEVRVPPNCYLLSIVLLFRIRYYYAYKC